MSHVKIGPSYFVREFQEYADWRWAFIRELAQNGIDAHGTKSINITLASDAGGLHATFENDGAPMDEDTLVNKFLSIGESGKNFLNGSVGGFGKAKLILCFAHTSYTIRTGSLKVSGSGGEYTLERGLPNIHGTRTEVEIAGGNANYESLIHQCKSFATCGKWSGQFILNGERLKMSHGGIKRRHLSFGDVYTSKDWTGTLVARINGVPMFRQAIVCNRGVILELAGSMVLTSNRDGLKSCYQDEINEFVASLAMNGRKALRSDAPQYTHYDGVKLGHRRAVDVRELVGSPEVHSDSGDSGSELLAAPAPSLGALATGEHCVVAGRAAISEEFVVKNYTRLKVPAHFLPDREFSQYSLKLARIWGRILVQLHRLFDHEAVFAIGFVFDTSTEAEFESDDRGVVYFLNPAKIVRQMNGGRSFRKRFKLTDRNRLIAIAAHEFVHGLGHSWHDETYAAKLTDSFGDIMDKRASFNWCFGA